MGKQKEGILVISDNRKAFHDFFVLDTYEVGIALIGCEVKSIRAGNCNLKDSFCLIRGKELFLENMYIKPYEQGSYNNKEPRRERKLLAHKQEIEKMLKAVKEKGQTIVPLKIYIKGGLVKIEIAVVKGKKLYDKREALKQKQIKRDIDRELS